MPYHKSYGRPSGTRRRSYSTRPPSKSYVRSRTGARSQSRQIQALSRAVRKNHQLATQAYRTQYFVVVHDSNIAWNNTLTSQTFLWPLTNPGTNNGVFNNNIPLGFGSASQVYLDTLEIKGLITPGSEPALTNMTVYLIQATSQKVLTETNNFSGVNCLTQNTDYVATGQGEALQLNPQRIRVIRSKRVATQVEPRGTEGASHYNTFHWKIPVKKKVKSTTGAVINWSATNWPRETRYSQDDRPLENQGRLLVCSESLEKPRVSGPAL